MSPSADHADGQLQASPAGPQSQLPAVGAGASPAVAQMLSLQRTVGNAAVARYLEDQAVLSRPDDPQELEAEGAARAVMGGRPAPAGAMAARSPAVASPAAGGVDAALAGAGPGAALPASVRQFMEPRFGTDFCDVRVHTGGAARRLSRALQAEAFTYGRDIYYGEGKAPANDELTAHELAHVAQQRGAVGQVAARRIQRSVSASFPVTLGTFEVDLQTQTFNAASAGSYSGLDGYIRFVPKPDAPNSNRIVMVQIVRTTDLGGADINSQTTPAAQAPRGALGDPGLRTQDDLARGIEGGFKTDVHHRPRSGAPGQPQGAELSPDYNFQPAAPGAPHTGNVQQPVQYGGGTGGTVGQTPGFKRSNNAADIRSAALYDTPGITGATSNLNMDFESVAKGEDTMQVYAAVKWGFQVRAGKVTHEYFNPVDNASATFGEALERHRDFYVHEPVTFYFDHDDDTLNGTETAKIDTFLQYLTRNPTVRMSLVGLADQSGGNSAHNRDLSRRRAEAVASALVAKRVDAGRIDAPLVAAGASATATADAGTGDQGGSPAVGADQTREANLWANRRVVLKFTQTASTPVGGAGP